MQAPVKHLDETSLRVEDRNRWVHVLCTPLLCVLRIAEGRAHIKEDITDIVVHDDYGTYRKLPDVLHATCNAHHLRGT